MGQETDKRNKLSHVIQFLGLLVMIRVMGQVVKKCISSNAYIQRVHAQTPSKP